jgi:hypothetical protein
MDEAAQYLPPNGIIVCLDADCEVAGNYLVAIWIIFQKIQIAMPSPFIWNTNWMDWKERKRRRLSITNYTYDISSMPNDGRVIHWHIKHSDQPCREKESLSRSGRNEYKTSG